jgi:hypothetical protein
MTEKILILDFGSQVTQLIARRVRELSVYCEIHPFNHIPEIGDDVKGLSSQVVLVLYVKRILHVWICLFSEENYLY